MTASSAVPMPSGAAAGAALFVAAAPVENRLGEDVVEQFVARRLASGRVDLAQDAAALAAAELLEHRRDLGLGPFRPVGEVRGGMGDLRLRARDEVAEGVGGDRLLATGEAAKRVVEVVLDDPLRAAECLEPGASSARARPPATVATHSRFITSCRKGASIASAARALRGVGVPRASPEPTRPVAAASITASTSSGSTV